MKLVKEGKVYDVSWGAYESVCALPSGWRPNAVGNMAETAAELRRDLANGGFYVAVTAGGAISRADVAIVPVSRAEAMALAEDMLDYDRYSAFFGDPEGGLKAAARRIGELETELKRAESSRDHWSRECDGLAGKVRDLEERLAKVDELAKSLAGGRDDG